MKRWFDLNKHLPLNYSNIPKPGIPKPCRCDLVVEETISPAVWKMSAVVNDDEPDDCDDYPGWEDADGVNVFDPD